jgi:uroporphyrinogen-III decarboxylase
MTFHETEFRENAAEQIRGYVSTLFDGMRPLDRFIFSSGCNTSIETSWDNLRYLRDACWEFGET